MSRMQRDKGARFERDIVNRHRDLGVLAKRVPGSGAHEYTHDADVDIYPFGEDAGAWIGECKVGAQVPKSVGQWLGENDMLFMRRDREQPVVVLPWARWCDLLGYLKG
jgi:hypothetical protein